MYEVTQEDVDHKIVVPESLRRSDWIIDESTSYLYLFLWQTNTRQNSVDSIYLSMVRLPDSPCLGRVRVKVAEPGPG